ncbi:hypothetical protein COO91_04120 [Nostoc flagelliforme CCNUN1]|uniref:Uncharacterized protein n=1 Tax=Nostoc flagelliforme CCNUN1 TaxID=2038116 RepID=A0A2K8STN9_9NOSO|nr:hypothetical protein COO91_04120 [Nostoc flagelliforme CCNUN1]
MLKVCSQFLDFALDNPSFKIWEWGVEVGEAGGAGGARKNN